MRDLESAFLEKLILKGLLGDKNYSLLVTNSFEPDYFDNKALAEIFKISKDYMNEHSSVIPVSIIRNSLNEDIKGDAESLLIETESIDFNINTSYDYLMTQTNEYLKRQALKNAIINSVDVIESNGNREQIRNEIEEALCKDIKVDLGLNYFSQLGERLSRIFNATDIRVPTYYSQFDEYINGGFPPFTLSVIVAKIHGGKSQTMINFAARQVLAGHNVVIMTLEMAQDAFAQRFDSVYSLLDINRMYLGDERRKLKDKLVDIKATENRGELYIKQFPTGDASVSDFRVYLRELLMRDIKPDILYIDYINLMKSVMEADGMYSRIKKIAEELRALSFEFEIPVVSVSQLNREGGFVGFTELDFNYVAESMGLPATADFMAIYGVDEDAMVYESETNYKLVKNRLGGRVGEIGTFYIDNRTLKMYDSSELDLWISDANITGDTRNIAEQNTRVPQNNNRGRR
jgi:replicative DNA helicase